MEKKTTGICFIAGAGPGDIDLITVRLLKLIGDVDVIIYDDLINKDLLKLRREGAETIYVGKRSGKHSMPQEEINSILTEKTGEGKRVLRLKGGDPFVFGRGSEECKALQEKGLRYSLVPGITSAVSVPEAAGIPVTERGVSRSFTVISGHLSKDSTQEEKELFENAARSRGTICFLMGLENIRKIVSGLKNGGMSEKTPAAVISSGTTINQYTVRGTLEDIAERAESDESVVTPAIIVVGELAAREYIGSRNPVIFVTGTKDMVEKERNAFRLNAVDTVACPHLTLKTNDEVLLEQAVEGLEKYTYLAFLSQHSVRFFMKAFLDKRDVRDLLGIKIACVGKATADFLKKEYGIRADLIPENYESESMARLVVENITDRSKARVLILRAKEGDRTINDIFRDNEVEFDDLSLYRLETDENVLKEIKEKNPIPDYITFASAEGVRKYSELDGAIGEKTVIICIGRYTADKAREIYSNKVVLTDRSDVESFVTKYLELEEY